MRAMKPLLPIMAFVIASAPMGALAQPASAAPKSALAPTEMSADPARSIAPNENRSQADEASDISAQIFGKPGKSPDYAYGAFQRGYYLTALGLALKRAAKNDAAAQTLIGVIYQQGLGVAQDAGKAAGWYTIAAHNGDPLAAFELALMYQSGTGVPKDGARAAKLFEQSAAKGYAPAKYNLALLYIEGLNVKPDMIKAAKLMKEAAEADVPEAHYDYGNMLIQGAGVPPNVEAGAKQIGMAAEEGLVAAEVDYATMLYLGNGVPRDHAAAVRWYKKAAEAGNPVAQNRYAKLLAVGEGVPLDLEQAAMWRALARRQGLNDPQLDKLLVSIPPAALKKAERRARYWPAPVPTPNDVGDLAAEQALPLTPLPRTLPGSGAMPAPADTDVRPPGPGGEARADQAQKP